MIQVDGFVIYTVGKSHRTFNGMYEKSEGKKEIGGVLVIRKRRGGTRWKKE